MKFPSKSDILSVINYSPETGILTWKHRPREMFISDKEFRRWNTRYSGKRVGVEIKRKSDGYTQRHFKYNGSVYREHRIVWIIMTGEEPPYQIDHINRDATDNRWSNLRDGTTENKKNRNKQTNNTSGVTGVRMTRSGSWSAVISVNGKKEWLGSFRTREAAKQARIDAEYHYGFSADHGKSIASYRVDS